MAVELILINRTFDADVTGWQMFTGTGTITQSTGHVVMTNVGGGEEAVGQNDQNIVVVSGSQYTFTADGFIGTAGSWNIDVVGVTTSTVYSSSFEEIDGSVNDTFTVTGDALLRIEFSVGVATDTLTSEFDNFSLLGPDPVVATAGLGGGEPGGRGRTSYGGRKRPPAPRRGRTERDTKFRGRARRNQGPTFEVSVTGDESLIQIRNKIELIDIEIKYLESEFDRYTNENRTDEFDHENYAQEMAHLTNLRAKALSRLNDFGKSS